MATGVAALNGAAVVTTATAPETGQMNRYNASAGALAITLPALSGLNIGTSCLVEKDTLDATLNTVTFTATGADTFDDGSTSLVLFQPGEKRTLQVIAVSGTPYWKIMDGYVPKGAGLAATTAQFALTNTGTATTILTTNLPAGSLLAGSTYRILFNGTVQVQSTSGTLTFTPYLQNTALAQTCQMPTQSAAGPVGFMLEYIITVRTTGSTGTAVAKPFGVINFTSPAYLFSTSASTTTVNTTAAAASTAIYVQAQWATASATNSLLVETATIERII